MWLDTIDEELIQAIWHSSKGVLIPYLVLHDVILCESEYFPDEGTLLLFDRWYHPVEVAYITEYVDVIVKGVAKERVNDELSHLLFSLLKAIEELDHVVDLLIVHDWLYERFEGEKRLKDEMDLLKGNKSHFP